MKKKGATAGELIAKLQADPKFVADRERREAEHRAKLTQLREAEAPLRRELAEHGLDVDSVWSLVNTSVAYTSALPILLAHLQRPYPPEVREGIARALAVREAHFAWEVLAALYRAESERRIKDGLAVALAASATDAKINDLVELVRDRRHGSSRLLLLSALERSPRPEARLTLRELRHDPDLVKEIRVILRRLDRDQH